MDWPKHRQMRENENVQEIKTHSKKNLNKFLTVTLLQKQRDEMNSEQL